MATVIPDNQANKRRSRNVSSINSPR